VSDKPLQYVFDSHSLIAYLEDETGAPRVRAILAQAENNQAEIFLTIINYGEVVYITEREKGLVVAQTVIAAIDQLPITVIDADRKLTFAAARIKAKYAVSYADAFAVALAQSLDAKILTGDPEFRSVEEEAAIEWLPSK
jgi:predicted nucleic acid-binding protein